MGVLAQSENAQRAPPSRFVTGIVNCSSDTEHISPVRHLCSAYTTTTRKNRTPHIQGQKSIPVQLVHEHLKRDQWRPLAIPQSCRLLRRAVYQTTPRHCYCCQSHSTSIAQCTNAIVHHTPAPAQADSNPDSHFWCCPTRLSRCQHGRGGKNAGRNKRELCRPLSTQL